MDKIFTCKISLSKKIRAMIGNNKTRIILNVNDISNGIGEGTMIVYSDDKIVIPDDFFNKETSIMIVPVSANQIGETMSTVTNIFNDNKGKSPIAATRAPETSVERAHAIKPPEVISQQAPEQFKETRQASYKRFVSNLNELMEELDNAKSINANVDFSSVPNPETPSGKRQMAILMEQKESLESIKSDAWVINEKCASLTLRDIDLCLPLNTPVNLNRFSAKKILSSKDLFKFIDDKYIRIITPDEAKDILQIATKQEKIDFGLKAYSGEHASEKAASAAFDDHKSEQDAYKETKFIEKTTTTKTASRTQPSRTQEERVQTDIDLDDGMTEEQRILNDINSAPSMEDDPFIGVESPIKKMNSVSGGLTLSGKKSLSLSKPSQPQQSVQPSAPPNNNAIKPKAIASRHQY